MVVLQAVKTAPLKLGTRINNQRRALGGRKRKTMTKEDLIIWLEAMLATIIKFMSDLWIDLTLFLGEWWKVWKMIFPADPMWDPYGSAAALAVALFMLLWIAPKEHY